MNPSNNPNLEAPVWRLRYRCRNCDAVFHAIPSGGCGYKQAWAETCLRIATGVKTQHDGLIRQADAEMPVHHCEEGVIGLGEVIGVTTKWPRDDLGHLVAGG